MFEYTQTPNIFSILSALASLYTFILILLLILNMNILQKSGRHGLWAFLIFIPPLYIIMVWIFAFADWPALKKRDDAEKASG